LMTGYLVAGVLTIFNAGVTCSGYRVGCAYVRGHEISRWGRADRAGAGPPGACASRRPRWPGPGSDGCSTGPARAPFSSLHRRKTLIPINRIFRFCGPETSGIKTGLSSCYLTVIGVEFDVAEATVNSPERSVVSRDPAASPRTRCGRTARPRSRAGRRPGPPAGRVRAGGCRGPVPAGGVDRDGAERAVRPGPGLCRCHR
jgi:hypothetical protein